MGWIGCRSSASLLLFTLAPSRPRALAPSRPHAPAPLLPCFSLSLSLARSRSRSCHPSLLSPPPSLPLLLSLPPSFSLSTSPLSLSLSLLLQALHIREAGCQQGERDCEIWRGSKGAQPSQPTLRTARVLEEEQCRNFERCCRHGFAVQ
jgi:hypothetical protein